MLFSIASNALDRLTRIFSARSTPCDGGGGGGARPLDKAGGGSLSKNFWSKYKMGGRAPQAPSLDPPLILEAEDDHVETNSKLSV